MVFFILILASVFSVSQPDDLSQEKSEDLPQNVVYISVDALSAEHLQCYGYHRETAPNICGMENSTIYRNAYATSHWTPISLASMQRGVYAHRANVVSEETPIDADYRSIADIMNEEGYKTILKSNHANVNRKSGIDKGFNETELHARSEEMKDFPREFGDSLEENNVYFRIHLVGSHDPYTSVDHYNYTKYIYIDEVNETISTLPREQRRAIRKGTYNITESERRRVIDHYDENIRAVDNYIGAFIEELKEAGEYEESLIVITSDHGESFNNYGEDVWLHMDANPAVSRVPLLIKYPNSTESEESSKLVSHMDPFKIILNEFRGELDYELDAIDPRSETRNKHFTYTKTGGHAITNRSHFVWRNDSGSWHSYRVNGTQVSNVERDLEELKTQLILFYEKVNNGSYRETVNITKNEEVRERLKDLGYIQ